MKIIYLKLTDFFTFRFLDSTQIIDLLSFWHLEFSMPQFGRHHNLLRVGSPWQERTISHANESVPWQVSVLYSLIDQALGRHGGQQPVRPNCMKLPKRRACARLWAGAESIASLSGSFGMPPWIFWILPFASPHTAHFNPFRSFLLADRTFFIELVKRKLWTTLHGGSSLSSYAVNV